MVDYKNTFPQRTPLVRTAVTKDQHNWTADKTDPVTSKYTGLTTVLTYIHNNSIAAVAVNVERTEGRLYKALNTFIGCRGQTVVVGSLIATFRAHSVNLAVTLTMENRTNNKVTMAQEIFINSEYIKRRTDWKSSRGYIMNHESSNIVESISVLLIFYYCLIIIYKFPFHKLEL